MSFILHIHVGTSANLRLLYKTGTGQWNTRICDLHFRNLIFKIIDIWLIIWPILANRTLLYWCTKSFQKKHSANSVTACLTAFFPRIHRIARHGLNRPFPICRVIKTKAFRVSSFLWCVGGASREKSFFSFQFRKQKCLLFWREYGLRLFWQFGQRSCP